MFPVPAAPTELHKLDFQCSPPPPQVPEHSDLHRSPSPDGRNNECYGLYLPATLHQSQKPCSSTAGTAGC